MDYEVKAHHLDQMTIDGEVYLLDILEKVRPHFRDAFDALSAASWLYIFRYSKIHALQAGAKADKGQRI